MKQPPCRLCSPQPSFFAVAIWTYQMILPPKPTILWSPHPLQRAHVEQKLLYADIVQAKTPEEARKTGLGYYKTIVVPHPHGEIVSEHLWKKHLERFGDNFYIDAVPVYAHEIGRMDESIEKRCQRAAKAALREYSTLLRNMTIAQP